MQGFPPAGSREWQRLKEATSYGWHRRHWIVGLCPSVASLSLFRARQEMRKGFYLGGELTAGQPETEHGGLEEGCRSRAGSEWQNCFLPPQVGEVDEGAA